MADRTGEILDAKYRLVRLLGSGGMGSVYEAEHLAIGKRVAVKFLHPQHAKNADTVRRFQQEARAAAAAGHRGIVDIHDIGCAPDCSPYLVMELLDGESFGALLARERPVSVDLAVGVALGTLSALAAAHRKGIVHRDIKPDNVFLERTLADEPCVKLLDFGVSKMSLAGETSTTKTGMSLGTPHYMAPEQARGDTRLDARVDLYAMGVILYEALTGVVPLDAPNYNALMVRILTDAPRPLAELRADLPPGLPEVIARAMAKDPDDRFRRAEDLIEALLPFRGLGGEAPGLARRDAQAPAVDASASTVHASGEGPLGISPVGDTLTPQSLSAMAPAARLSPRRSGWIAGVALLLLGAGAGAIWLVTRGAEPPAATATWERPAVPVPSPPVVEPPTPPPAPSPPRSVTITIEGAPPGARVFLGDARVPELPIRLPASDVMVQLRVEADGFEAFSQMIAPSRDQSVLVQSALARPARRSGKAARGSDSIVRDTSEFALP